MTDDPATTGPDRVEPEIEPPLKALGGEVPPAPEWFQWAIEQEPERARIPVDGADIELLTWGEVGKPGLVFVHGNNAHADWWSFIAPFLASDYRVAAISSSGSGESDWRSGYSFEIFGNEARAAAVAAGMYEASLKPIFIGHSFGGVQVLHSAVNHPDWMRGAILIDTDFDGHPPSDEGYSLPQGRSEPNRIYPDLPTALARFRLMPAQRCANLFIADFIARRSLKPVSLPGGEGWTWRFDPLVWKNLDPAFLTKDRGRASQMPMVYMHGDRSKVVGRLAEQLSYLPSAIPQIVIPDSAHHIMFDQPLALTAALCSVLSLWPKPAAI